MIERVCRRMQKRWASLKRTFEQFVVAPPPCFLLFDDITDLEESQSIWM